MIPQQNILTGETASKWRQFEMDDIGSSSIFWDHISVVMDHICIASGVVPLMDHIHRWGTTFSSQLDGGLVLVGHFWWNHSYLIKNDLGH